MAHLAGQLPFYYYVLQGRPNVLADERDKKKLLDIVLGVQQAHELELYAFCITNEEICLMLGAETQAEINKGIRQLISEFALRQIDGRKPAGGRGSGEKLTVVQKRKLRSQQEVRIQCRAIHTLPVSKGYVTQVKDYWWSSYQTYLGYYDWEQVSCSAVLRMFSDDAAAARRQLRRFHGFV